MSKINPPAEEFAIGDLVSWTGECYQLSGRIPGKKGAEALTSIRHKVTHTGLVVEKAGDHLEVLHGEEFYVLQLMLPIEKLAVWKEEVW